MVIIFRIDERFIGNLSRYCILRDDFHSCTVYSIERDQFSPFSIRSFVCSILQLLPTMVAVAAYKAARVPSSSTLVQMVNQNEAIMNKVPT